MISTPSTFWTAGKTFLLALVAGGLLGACASTAAYDDTFTPTTLSERDRQLMERAAQDALENNNIGQTTNWNNPETGHLGGVTPMRTYRTATDQPCRDYMMTVTLNGPTRFDHSTACRMPDGSWVDREHAGPAGAFFEGYADNRPVSRYDEPDYRVPRWEEPYYGSPPGHPSRPVRP